LTFFAFDLLFLDKQDLRRESPVDPKQNCLNKEEFAEYLANRRGTPHSSNTDHQSQSKESVSRGPQEEVRRQLIALFPA
jgi:hypothetical protein